ncbi:MAG: hypothetical protein COB85_01295 [Bacteroidetes bacterium]|nr:MAG: hypothetical protein COB85_01295 [Bacteroidota bacterium]
MQQTIGCLKKENQMVSRKLIVALFIITAISQLAVPAKMIFDREDIMAEGKDYKFKTEPIDPSDPFRGKYITLRFEEDQFEVQDLEIWERGEPIYLELESDDNGFSKIKSVAKSKPLNSGDFLKAMVRYAHGTNSEKLTIQFPFDRYYMEESKAFAAEQAYVDALNDTSQITYALVAIKDGESVLKDVLINGVPIKEIAKARAENSK